MGLSKLKDIFSSPKTWLIAAILLPALAIGVTRLDDIYVLTLRSSSSNPATNGMIRMATGDAISWRNAANTANLSLQLNGSDHLEFNGVLIPTPSSGSFSDGGFDIYNATDNTKEIVFSAANITTGTTRTITMANANVDLSNINAATITVGHVAVANGGTGQSTATAAFNALSPMTTAGDMITYGSGSAQRIGTSVGQTGYFWQSGGGLVSNGWTNNGSTLTNINAAQLQGYNIATTSPTSNQLLIWNATTSKWNPITPSASGIVTSISTDATLTGGPITGVGTLQVDVGTAANQIVQLNSNAQEALAAGTASLPSYSFSSDATTGAYLPSSGNMNLVAGGQIAASISESTDTTCANVGFGGGGASLSCIYPFIVVRSQAQQTEFVVENTNGNAGASPGIQLIGDTGAAESADISLWPNAESGIVAYQNRMTIHLTGSTQGLSILGTGASPGDIRYYYNGGASTNEYFRVNSAAVTLENGEDLVFNGSTSGALTLALGATNGGLGVNTTTPNALLDLNGTGTLLSSIILPRDTTANRPSTAVNGMIRYNNALNAAEVYQNSGWQSIVSTPVSIANGGTAASSSAGGEIPNATSGSAASWTNTPTLGLSGVASGTLTLDGSASGAVTIGTSAAAGTWTLTLPAASGANGQYLQNVGSGTTSWTAITSLQSYSIATTSPTSGQILTWNSAASNWYPGASALSNPMTTGGDIIYGGASGVATRLANGTTGQVLESGGSTNAPVWTTLTAPTHTIFSSTGSTAGYVFGVTSANATVGATYTNNSVTFTVLATISSGTLLYTSSSGAPAASGTLTKASGTGDSTITFSSDIALATYSPPAGCKLIKVTAIGGGGGGGGTASTTAQSGAGGGGGAGGVGIKYYASPGSTYYYAVGFNGSAGSAGNNAGGNGGTTFFDMLGVYAGPGSGGGGSASSSSATVGGGGGGGGAPTGFDLNYAGGDGAAGIIFTTLGAVSGMGGSTSGSGTGAQSIVSTSAAGNNGNAYGGGGSGGAQINGGGTKAGGAGAAGGIIIEEYYQ